MSNPRLCLVTCTRYRDRLVCAFLWILLVSRQDGAFSGTKGVATVAAEAQEVSGKIITDDAICALHLLVKGCAVGSVLSSAPAYRALCVAYC